MSRAELVQSAVSFLRDPSVAQSPIANRISFLTAKGLTQSEIDEAMRQANATGYAGPSSNNAYASQPRYGQMSVIPQDQGRDWRDWFIMTVIGGSVGYLTIALARKYLFPALQPPTSSALTEAQDALTAKYDEAAAVLSSLEADTEALKSAFDEQSAKLDVTVKEVTVAVKAIKEKEEEREDDMRQIRDEIDAIKDMIPRMLEKNKDAQSTALTDLQQELKSLKSLLIARRPGAVSGSEAAPSASEPGSLPSVPASSPGMPFAGNRFGYATGNSASVPGTASSSFAGLTSRPPGIPAWQLASTPSLSPGANANAQAPESADSKEVAAPAAPAPTPAPATASAEPAS
ncbi:uncharacterized protein L969DRAFT_95511 [Mixia osmundae IAM 14324]|uniref:Peroxisomal membrane protein PEX14 n=1 Tax=Mixia osmundae (strain CBS 9802 / IAM 14324 / JCM 22182 / KY 12970) TaxID=764103 RepID=G7E7M3_MIXOS|nr:uncharacterized protein L969DRAFT_95511 [Mixia osmundae IAM 14324]KEI38433.1 hypothetical protein L969DRAFT_95511 [Mixia osmundae IAM 14324]GAA98833.1 hypothetical protein E5Q_05521 [Mixia osmundae IAM 14324]